MKSYQKFEGTHPSFRSFRVKKYTKSKKLHPDVINYFRDAVPVETEELEGLYIHDADGIGTVNEGTDLGISITPFGLITFGSTGCGDLITVDVETGLVYQFSPSTVAENIVNIGWNDDCTKWIELPFNKENVLKAARNTWDCLAEFFKKPSRHYN